MPTSPNDSTTPSPEKNPHVIWDEVAEWNRLLDYEEDAILRGIEKGIAARKKDLEERRRLDKESNVRQKMEPPCETQGQNELFSSENEPSPSDIVPRIIEAKYEDYCDRVVQMIQGLPADCRQSGDDSVLEDVWEEFKYQVQRQESVVFEVYEDTITALCQKVVEGLPQHERDLLWLASDGYFDWDEQDGSPDKTNDVVAELYRRVCTRASDEDLKIDPEEDADSER